MTKRKKQSNIFRNIIISIIIIIITMIAFFAGYAYHVYEDDIFKLFQNETIVIGGEHLGCEGQDLFKTTQCLTRKVRSFYKYTVTADDVDLTLEEIRTQGGDCYDYSKLYATNAKRLGFNYEFVYVPMTRSTMHVYVIIYDSSGYCAIDGVDTLCMKYIE